MKLKHVSYLVESPEMLVVLPGIVEPRLKSFHWVSHHSKVGRLVFRVLGEVDKVMRAEVEGGSNGGFEFTIYTLLYRLGSSR